MHQRLSRRLSVARAVANVVNLSTPLGLAVAVLTRTPLHRGPDALILGTGYRPRLPHAGAFTIGNVVLFRADSAFIAANPRLLAHECRHSTQYAYCLGLPFLPLYAVCAVYSQWQTGNPGSCNFFERQASLADGGYPDRPHRHRLGAF